jgi:hypothetical protein
MEFGNVVRLVEPDRSKCLRFLSSEKSNGSDCGTVRFFNTIFCNSFIKLPIHSRNWQKNVFLKCGRSTGWALLEVLEDVFVKCGRSTGWALLEVLEDAPSPLKSMLSSLNFEGIPSIIEAKNPSRSSLEVPSSKTLKFLTEMVLGREVRRE